MVCDGDSPLGRYPRQLVERSLVPIRECLPPGMGVCLRLTHRLGHLSVTSGSNLGVWRTRLIRVHGKRTIRRGGRSSRGTLGSLNRGLGLHRDHPLYDHKSRVEESDETDRQGPREGHDRYSDINGSLSIEGEGSVPCGPGFGFLVTVSLARG